MNRKATHFFWVGTIESKNGLINGYCEVTETGYIVPPLGKRAAQSDAKARGLMAIFHGSEYAARMQMLRESNS